MYYPEVRMRRLRQSEKIRNLVAETRLHPDQFILPIFFDENIDKVKTTGSMPGVKTFPLSGYDKIASDIQDSGVNSVLVFGVPAHKDAVGSGAYARDGVVQKAIEGIKENSDMLVIADLCLCKYTDHGHCGVLDSDGCVINDDTLELYAKTAVSQADAEEVVREYLQEKGTDTAILSEKTDRVIHTPVTMDMLTLEEPEEDEGEVIILEIQKDENDEDIYVSVEDEAVSDAVFEKFMEMVEEQDDE